MPFVMAKYNPWEYLFSGKAKPFYEKSLEQNLVETSLLMQTAGLALPGAYAFKVGTAYPTTAAVAAKAVSGAAAATTTAAGAGGGTAAATTAGALGLATTGLKVGGGLVALDWLKENWWIAALLLGGLVAYKWVK